MKCVKSQSLNLVTITKDYNQALDI